MANRVFFLSIAFQVKLKLAALSLAKQESEKKDKDGFKTYNRYTDNKILAGDRAVGNFLEWQGAFLALFWMNAYFTGQAVWLGWVYVAARLAYLALAKFAIRPGGIRPILLVTTVPAYVVLFYYFAKIAAVVF